MPIGLSARDGAGELAPATLLTSTRVDPWRGALLGVAAMATGTVKWFNMAKGFGFIAPDGGGPDVFVHVSAVERSGLTGLREGQAISFDVENDPRKNKPSAVNLKPV